MKKTITLPDYVRSIMERKGLTSRAVERNAVDAPGDHEISHTYIAKIAGGAFEPNPTISALRALAAGLMVPEDEIFDVARGRGVDLDDEDARAIDRLADIYRQLDEAHRRQLAMIAETCLLTQSGHSVLDESGAVLSIQHA